MPTTAQNLIISLVLTLTIPSIYRKMQDKESLQWWWNYFCSSSLHAAMQRSIRILGCLEGAVGTARMLCLECPNLYIFASHAPSLHFFSRSDSFTFTSTCFSVTPSLLFVFEMRVFSFFGDNIQWGKRSGNKCQKCMSRGKLWSRTSLEILCLNMLQTTKACVSRMISFYLIPWMFRLWSASSTAGQDALAYFTSAVYCRMRYKNMCYQQNSMWIRLPTSGCYIWGWLLSYLLL